MENIQPSEKIETIAADLAVPEIEQEQQDKNNNTDVTSGLDIFDLAAEVGSDLIDVLGDVVSGISLDL
ncbi:hypothetical protein [Acinetobacter terrae]|jgi:hypothetical protein|uniref:Uncharacterized protein n=1 Tax=Acinetobacter terrae TaxID=2731247 RepID=A0A8E4FCK6_9GAMM|nr:hypothetical protein [Acinetobacter terrae]NNH17367.1 hypothetical protein [Acinetobacter terrae]NNH38606.1 hypothetical protein [Acinetobacter terrae]NNH86340.1 hypothetical protein [Acinetobacter terrae]OAL84051.1 hypothetical protein AY608_14910 [Acinetobacter terrae]